MPQKKRKRNDVKKLSTIIKAHNEGRPLNSNEQAQYDRYRARMDRKNARRKAVKARVKADVGAEQDKKIVASFRESDKKNKQKESDARKAALLI